MYTPGIHYAYLLLFITHRPIPKPRHPDSCDTKFFLGTILEQQDGQHLFEFHFTTEVLSASLNFQNGLISEIIIFFGPLNYIDCIARILQDIFVGILHSHNFVITFEKVERTVNHVGVLAGHGG